MPETAPVSFIGQFLSFIAQALFYLFMAGIGTALLLNLRSLLRSFDALFETNPDSEDALRGARVEPWSELLQPEGSAADYRTAADVVRALKEQLDADVQAAVAAIQRERARNNQQPRKDRP